MLSLRRNVSRAITFAILVSTALADVVVLKTGEKVEGKIVKESDQQVTLEIKVSAGITDERVITRAEIDRIDKVSPEMEAYKVINTIQLGNNSLATTQYDPAIRILEAYIKQYPDGAHTADVQATLTEFLAEQKRVEGGEAKVRGQWLTKAEVEKEKIQIGGLLSLEQMKNLSAAGDNIGALNLFASIEKIYGGSASMPEMIELARQLAAAIVPAAERAIPDQKVLKARKEKGIADSGPVERVEMAAAYKAEMAQAEAATAAAVAAHQWPPFIVTNEKCLKTLLEQATKETTRLNALPVDNMKRSIQLTTAARKSIEENELGAAATTLKEATTLWPTNELANRLTKEMAAAAKEKPAEAAPATPAPETPKPKTTAAPKPSAAAKTAAAAQTAPVEEPTPFYMTLPGAIGIVVAIAGVLAGVNIYKKMKAKNSDPEAL